MHHILTIYDDYEDFGRECEVEHLPDCPTELQYDGQLLVWKCQVGWFLDELGLPDHLTVLPVGEYPIEFWQETRTNYTGATEYEYGIDLVDSVDS